MQIKEAEKLTGLSAKTIRFYESKGLINVKRSSNAYREYDEENVNQLRRIKILRKLEVPISKIKEFIEAKILLKDILETKLKELDENELELTCKKSTLELILKDINKNPNKDLIEYDEGFNYIESEEFTEVLAEMKELSQFSLSKQILITLMLSGPLLWLFTDIGKGNYNFIGVQSILSIISTVLLTLTWSKFLKQPNKKTKGTCSMLLGIPIAIILTLTVFVGITKFQEVMFVPKDYLMFMFKPPYSYLIFFFEIEIIIIFISMLYKNIKNVEWKWSFNLLNFMKKNTFATVIINIVLLYVCVTGITVVTKNEIVDYNFYNPKGTVYSYNDITKVQTGFKGKLFKVFRKNAGEFYYIVNFKDGKKINFYQANSAFTDTYLEIEIFDKIIMDINKVEKISSSDNHELCNFDKRYVDRFLRIIKNR